MARIISKKTLEEIRTRNDIVDVVGSHIALKRAGSSFKANCPFHKEKTPSFHVNPQRQIYHCFGCGAGGDVFGFIMQYEGVDFTTAVKMLADRAGVPLELEEGKPGESGKNELLKLHAEIARFYHKVLLDHKSAEHAREYIKKRDLSSESVEEFMLGYAPDRWDTVTQWAEKNKFTAEQVNASGLLSQSAGEGGKKRKYDRFRGRLMFPISDGQGRIIGFSGRILAEDAKGAKYVNSPETLLFHKSRVLYGLDKARREIVETREAVIVEGQIDVIMCHQAGFKTAVASQGTAFTADHAVIVRRYADSVCIAFDSDRAGQDSAIKTAIVFMSAGLAVRIAMLPSGEDPASLIQKKGASAFKRVLDAADSAIAFQVKVLSERENMESEVGLMRVSRAVLNTVSYSPSAVQTARLIQEAAGLLNLPASALQDELKTVLRSTRAERDRSEKTIVPDRVKYPPEEEALCEHLAHETDHPGMAGMTKKYLPLEHLTHPVCRAFIGAVLESSEKSKDLQEVVRDIDKESGELSRFAAKMIMAPCKVKGSEISREETVKGLILRIWQKHLKNERAQIEKQMNTEAGKLDEKLRGRSAQVRKDLKSLSNWQTGAVVMEIHMEEIG